MLTELDFVEQQRQLGCKIHQHDGVFWEEKYPFFCRPAFLYKSFHRGQYKPAFQKSLLGYSHMVLTKDEANDSKSFMVLDRSAMDGYSIEKILQKKRSQVRQALNACEVKLITNLDEDLIERLRLINIEQSQRQEAGFGAETPAKRYIDEAEDWKKQIRRDFSFHGREWWGAYVEGQLAGYLRTYQVDNIRVLEQSKTDTAFFKYRPVDALYFSMIMAASQDPNCHMIMNGDPRHQSLNHYKEQFLFKPVSLPCYTSNIKVTSLIKRFFFKR